MNRDGFSVVELMITIVITGIVVGLVSSNLTGLQKIATRFNEQAAFREQYLIFLLKFEEDYQQAEIKSNMEVASLDDLLFQTDLNLDGDNFDAGEKIAYRWNKKYKRIDRKSGNGSFQAFVESVDQFNWQRISNQPICHQLILSSVFTKAEYKVDHCRVTSVY